MKKIISFGMLIVAMIIIGCDRSHNFMDVDNSNAKDDFKNMVGSGKIPKLDLKDIVPDSLSGKLDEARGYANMYYEDTLEEYVDVAKEGLSGTSQKIKGYYNSGVDQLNGIITESVNGVISGELNKIKVK